MKKFFFSFVILISVIFAEGQNTSNLTISTTGNTNLKITFNNKKYSLLDRSVTWQALTPGNYPLTIFQLQNKPGGGTEYVNVFERNITLNAQKHLEISVMRFGKTNWDEGYIERDEWNGNYYNPQPGNDQGNYRDRDRDRAVTDVKFAGIKKALNAEYNEDERLNVAKIAMKDNWFSIAQIREMCQTFYNEDKKLQLAKYAYDFCVDRGSYITLGDIFYNTNNRRSLMEYISTR